MTEHKLISVIIPNWNGAKTLGTCLDSIRKQTYPGLELVVVDNNSTDDSKKLVETGYPEAVIISNTSNKGFPAAINAGLKAARGHFFMLLNNDTEMEKECIEMCYLAIIKDPRYGACATKFLLADKRDTVDAAGIIVYRDGLSIGRGRMEKAADYNERTEIFFPSDGACLYRRDFISDIGYYDEDFFCYAEEADMGWRAQLRGWKSIYEPKAVVYHRHSASTGTYSPFKAFLVERNRMWVVLKTFPVKHVLLCPVYTFYRYVFQSFGAITGKGAAGHFSRQYSRVQLVAILLRCYFSFFATLLKTLRKRKDILRRKLISNRDFDLLLARFGISAREIAFKE